jgi:hypothetical protein
MPRPRKSRRARDAATVFPRGLQGVAEQAKKKPPRDKQNDRAKTQDNHKPQNGSKPGWDSVLFVVGVVVSGEETDKLVDFTLIYYFVASFFENCRAARVKADGNQYAAVDAKRYI